MPMIALTVTWKQLGFFVLLYLAALQNIPSELYEAAEVDGAGPVRQFTAVTVPGVRSATTLVVILATIIGANLFTEPYLLTGGGGPNGASTSPVLLMYQTGIEQGHAGYAAAIGVILAIGVMVISRGSNVSCWRGTDDGDIGGRAPGGEPRRAPSSPFRAARRPGCSGCLALVVGAFVFLFPFYYMVIGSLQREPQTDLAGAFPNPANLTVDNFTDINAQVDLARTLVNSGIFTGASCCRRSCSACWPVTRWRS